MPSPLSRRLTLAMSEMNPRPERSDLARAAEVKLPSVTDWFNGKTRKLGKALVPTARFLNVMPEWLNDGKLPMRPPPGPSGAVRVAEARPSFAAGSEIVFIDAPGSCGNGRGEMPELPRVITMGAEWFDERGLRADDLFAIKADGDANADYITHGDTVIFDSTARTPETGRIFLIQHPDGLRIRRLRRDIDGSWMLEYLSQDVHKYPPERIPPDQLGLLKIEGRFVYRLGG